MQTYHLNTKVTSEGSLFLSGLPFKPGQEVDVMVRPHAADTERQDDEAWIRMGLVGFFNDDAEGDAAYDLL